MALPTAAGLLLAFVLLALLGASSNRAVAAPLNVLVIRFVAPAGNDTANDCTNSATPCQTVQHGLDVALPGEEIWVATGVYTRAGGTVATITQTVTLQGGWNLTFTVNDPAGQPTVLDGQRLQPVVVISPTTLPAGAQISPTVEGLVITHGRGTTARCPPALFITPTECGGGIQSLSADPLILNNVISDNVGADNPQEGEGGGIFLYSAGATSIVSGNLIISNVANLSGRGLGGGIMERSGLAAIQGNQIWQNRDSLVGQSQGAGIQLAYSPVSLIGNDIRGNVSTYRGGGLWVSVSPGPVIISGNTFLSNTALVQGGALLINGDVPVQISHNTLAYNRVISPTAGRGGAIRITTDPAGVTITQNDFYSNVAAWGGGSAIDLAAPAWVDGNYLHANQNGQWGAALVLTAPVTVTNNLVVNNLGAGIEATDFGASANNVRIVNNTVVGNQNAIGGAAGTGILVTFDVAPGAGITATLVNNLALSQAACGIDFHNPPAVVSHHNDVLLNGTDFCGGAASAGNLSLNPLFVNTAAGNYHLRWTSPAVNTGSNAEAPATDFDGVSRPQGLFVDIGAYELRINSEVLMPLIRR